jgi:hypothetical protein
MHKGPEQRGPLDGERDLSRRNFLTAAGIVAAGGVLTGCNLISGDTAVAATPPELPWKYTKLDPNEAGQRGYQNYLLNGG